MMMVSSVHSASNFLRQVTPSVLTHWPASQARYAEQESELLLGKLANELRIQDRLRRMIVITPWLVPLYCLTVGRGALDGWAGIYYALQRGVAETLLALKLIEEKLGEASIGLRL